jgi:exopolysaccharide biosynthesis polyprenyl glycosylphosphotransferase
MTGWQRYAKRAIDLVGSGFGLTLLSPLFFCAAIAIKMNSKGPVFFCQERIGKNGRKFNMIKFRTMFADAEKRLRGLLDKNEAQGAIFKMKKDPRITAVGRLIRRFSIDEFPQIINVFIGQMSLVGPRPPLERELAEYESWQLKRVDTVPGMTGLWQVSGRSDLPFSEMVRLDIEYIERWSLWLDIKILLKTIPTVLSGRGAY